MAIRVGLGPVFACEWVITSRRWRTYGLRSLFVAGLLLGLVVVYWSRVNDWVNASLRSQARVGEGFYFALVSVQLALVMLAAPAATAGAICQDKSRGTLLHLLVTDLSDAEIVLGKLAARLVPTLMLVGCALPVMALLTLLGGIDPLALTGAFLITVGVATLGCALALTFSVWGTKTHEVLLATYAVWVFWLLADPLAGQALAFGPAQVAQPLVWLADTDPFRLAFAPYAQPGSVTLTDHMSFLLATLVISTVLTGMCVWRTRAVAIRQTGRLARSRQPPRFWRHRVPGPSLDANPVLWREWHRNRPSRWSGLVWILYLSLAALFSVLAALGGDGGVTAWVNGLQVAIGLLLVSVSAATSLAEERVRGSLDVLLSTPLPTATLVLGKWLGACRVVPILVILPVVAITPVVIGETIWPTQPRAWFEALAALVVMVFLILAQGAAIVSLGLALATWVARLCRAVALTVTTHVLMTVGWLFLGLMLLEDRVFEGMGMASPFFGVGNLTFWLVDSSGPMQRFEVLAWGLFWGCIYSLVAAGLVAATLRTFNRCLGRIESRADVPAALARPGKSIPLRRQVLVDAMLDDLAQAARHRSVSSVGEPPFTRGD
jgi:ABC-type transport system involved in multi-copper enzyme maturation permease subunit